MRTPYPGLMSVYTVSVEWSGLAASTLISDFGKSAWLQRIKKRQHLLQVLACINVMPFGLTNSPYTFERLMEDVLRGLQWEECLLYLDDIIVPGSTFDQTLERLKHVFIRLREANLKLKPSKCMLFQASAKFLGHIVSENGIQTDPDKISAIKNLGTPTKPKEVKSFLGLASYYRRFVQGFTNIARPLQRICNKRAKFSLSTEQAEDFQTLKEAFMSSPIRAFPQANLPFILDTDASHYAVP